MSYKTEYEKWLNRPQLDPELLAELRSIRENDDEIRARFERPLSFGTAGLRGIMRAGICGMNRYTVAQATQGLATLVRKNGGEKRGVTVCCDTRNNSVYFARVAAQVLAHNGVKVYLFDAPRPTPELSFALRHLGCIAGVNITASHNPKAYNGYKAYWEDGAQISPDHAKVVSEEIAATDIFSVGLCDFDEAVKDGRIEWIGEAIDDLFIGKVLEQRLDPEAVASVADTFKVVYTPIHGTGAAIVPKALERAGIKHILTVAEQMTPDGDFPTVRVPNPEDKDCFLPARKLAEQNGCDLIVGTDPDADRVGVLVKRKNGEYFSFNGNQIGALLTDYVIKSRKEQGTLPANACVIKSIVSTELARRICEKNGVTLVDVLTGFKFVGEKIKEYEKTNEHTFIFGFEESYGYLAGTYARDKDAVLATVLITEMAAVYSKQGMDLYDALLALYAEYGWYSEAVDNLSVAGLDGLEKTRKLMNGLREASIASLGGIPVAFTADYLSGVKTDADGGTAPTGLPKSDILYYALEDGSSVVVRPSGTEPKVKVYYLVTGADEDAAEKKLADLRASMQEKLDA